MYRRNDPRFRRTINEISHTLETANETAQAGVYVFGQQYINPCLSSISACFQPCVAHFFPGRDQRSRGRRSRAELNFDFYDDWEEDENDGLLGWDDEEYDGFLAGPGVYGATQQQPARQRAMSYGTRGQPKTRRKSDAGADEGASYFGFLGKLTSKLGTGKNLRYKPSAAGLQVNPGANSKKSVESESEPLITDESEGDLSARRRRRKKNYRDRSGTDASERTTDSLSSRGDLFPSEDEDDAVMLDDEFAMVLERRNTGTGSSGPDDGGGGPGKRPRLGSRRSTARARSSRSTPRSRMSRTASHGSLPTRDEGTATGTGTITMTMTPAAATVGQETVSSLIPTLDELKAEEDRARIDEEAAVQRRRDTARKLAEERGLSAPASPTSARTPERHPSGREEDAPTPHAARRPEDEFGDFETTTTTTTTPVAGRRVSTDGLEGGRKDSFEAARLPRFD